MLKCSSERWVCAPQSFSAGTSTTPRLSLSFLISGMVLSFSPSGSPHSQSPNTAAISALLGFQEGTHLRAHALSHEIRIAYHQRRHRGNSATTIRSRIILLPTFLSRSHAQRAHCDVNQN